MIIEIWSDYVCPFCYIGKRRLEEALKSFDYKGEIQLVFRSFELNPDAPIKYDDNIHELISKKYGISLEQAKSSNQQIIAQAKAIGLDFNFDIMLPTNTFLAHRLSHYANSEGKLAGLSERLLKAYFTDGLNLADDDVLARLAQDVGLDYDTSLAILHSERYTQEVRLDESTASHMGISGVPYFVFDSKYAVSGAQTPAHFLDVLNKVKNEERPEVQLDSSATQTFDSSSDHCDEDQCNL